MNVGLPGTGISGYFYFCLVLWMPVRQLRRSAANRSASTSWTLIRRQIVMLLIMLTLFYLQAGVLGYLLWHLIDVAALPPIARNFASIGVGYLSGMTILVPFVFLLLVSMLIRVTRLVRRWSSPAASAPLAASQAASLKR